MKMVKKRLYALAVSLMMLLAIPGLLAPAATAAPVSRDQYVQLVVQRGLSQRGVPYAWAGGDINGPTLGKGESAAVVGFDSSGLIQYIYAGVGAKLPRSSGDMYKVGQHVTADQALPGDLIFYGPDGTQSVAMFLGNQQMLEVTDTVVAVSPVRAKDMAPYLVRVIA
ncbi:NLP/P60 protein [uncultured Mycobacterium sp.]|uniref:NLP/P60 protein n=1 Tax=uncultured Mycobacterium sp. TaxID=171292 RepID=A0A1Y5NW13_9MYCO|nr:NLP/P60 protein [uncultured Mycobacterium sp.]